VSWELPPTFDVLRRRLETQAGKQGKREYIRILRLLERFSLEQLTIGIERACQMGKKVRFYRVSDLITQLLEAREATTTDTIEEEYRLVRGLDIG